MWMRWREARAQLLGRYAYWMFVYGLLAIPGLTLWSYAADALEFPLFPGGGGFPGFDVNVSVSVRAEVYYPAETAGRDVEPSGDSLPVVLVLHGNHNIYQHGDGTAVNCNETFTTDPDPHLKSLDEIRDDMLRMLFVCCDDGIPAESQLVLALNLHVVRQQQIEMLGHRSSQRVLDGDQPCVTSFQNNGIEHPVKRFTGQSVDISKIIEYSLFAIRTWFTLKSNFHLYSNRVVSIQARRTLALLDHPCDCAH